MAVIAGIRVALMKVLEHYLTPQQYKRYAKTDRPAQQSSPQHFYNAALRDLSIRSTESAIFNLIKVFEVEPRHLPSLHLARTMLFGLNKLFQEAGGDLYRTKFPNLNSYRQRLDRSLQEMELDLQRVRNEITVTQGKKSFMGGLFGDSKRQQRLAELQQQQQNLIQNLQQSQKRRTQVMKLVQIQEYANVISLVLEVSMFPARYSWLAEEENKAVKGESLKDQVWYG